MIGTDADWSRLDVDVAAVVNPRLAAGWSRILLFAGLAVLAVGTLLSAGAAVGVGVGIVLVAFGLNTAGKLVHYRETAVPPRQTLILSGTWLLLATTVAGALVTYARARYGSGGGGYFWPLALAGFGFGLLHMAAQAKLLRRGEREG